MLVKVADYLRSKKIVPPGKDLKKDSFGTSRTQEKRRPSRVDVVPWEKRSRPL